jgi:hypothetical protein
VDEGRGLEGTFVTLAAQVGARQADELQFSAC